MVIPEGEVNKETKASVSRRLKEELIKYGLVSAYLYVCFSILLLYKSSVLDEHGIEYLPYGLALVKALVLGKFILIGDVISVGSRADHHPLLHRIAWKSLAFLLALMVFVALEELIVGWFHDRTAGQVLAEFLERSWVEKLAPSALMLMILVPLVTATELYRSYGPERLKAAMLEQPTDVSNNP